MDSQPEASVFDIDAAAEQWGLDPGFIQGIVRKFIRQAPRDLAELNRLRTANEVEEFTRIAHGLKGASGYVGARRVGEIARKLEEMGRAGDLSQVDPALEELQAEIQRCSEYALAEAAPLSEASTSCS